MTARFLAGTVGGRINSWDTNYEFSKFVHGILLHAMNNIEIKKNHRLVFIMCQQWYRHFTYSNLIYYQAKPSEMGTSALH